MRPRRRHVQIPNAPRPTGTVKVIHPAFGCPVCLRILDRNTFAALDACHVDRVRWFDAYHRAHTERGQDG